jgi:hypothetical protein
MRKLTQSVSRIIKFYLALVQATGRVASVIEIQREEGLLMESADSVCCLSAEEYSKSTHLNVDVCYGTKQEVSLLFSWETTVHVP